MKDLNPKELVIRLPGLQLNAGWSMGDVVPIPDFSPLGSVLVSGRLGASTPGFSMVVPATLATFVESKDLG